MSKAPKVFFSYSVEKSVNPPLVQRVLEEAKAATRARKWGIIDPMIDMHLGQSVRDKVEIALLSSDACIVECTASVPNVMFETGFGRSLNYPIVFLISPETREDPRLQSYFEFIGLDKHRRLPADLGDIEYIIYPSKLDDAEEWTKFGEDLEKIMDFLGRSLAPSARQLRSTAKLLMHETFRLLERHPTNHPMLRFFSGWQSQLTEEMIYGGDSVFEVDGIYYRRCIANLGDTGEAEIFAIADLSDETEEFWWRSDPLKATERIFLVSWKTFFVVNKLSELRKLLKEQSQYYTVRIGDAEELPLNRVFGNATQGHHLLLIGPDLVGGYVERDGRKFLRLERSETRYKEAKDLYDQVKRSTIVVNPAWSDSEIRSAWMNNKGIGRWNPDWESVANRGVDYTGKYDMHIRAWIPDYDRLISYCVSIAQSEVVRLIRGTKRRLRILEIGFGTGALTIPLVQWVDNLNRPFLKLEGEPIVDLYVGVDESDSMRRILQREMSHGDFRTRYLLYEGTALDRLPGAAVNNAPFDLICGSLVFHDLIKDRPDRTLAGVLSRASQLLSPHGSLVLADPFTEEDDQEREAQVKHWRQRMIGNGLAEGEVDSFIRHNPEMVKTVTMAQLVRHAPAHGFLPPELKPVPVTSELSPFKVLVLRKSGSEED
jgi:hypothetical protein